ncbi:uncharacterized protein L969DRAFT_50113 [Mixia osmundae IAM 14324]|uniref:Uncharacterized protein n=1 Tax=Mixia osmundae (strain CBS 9802 / IAM 14324 / JCM 22182 / KY 12970) TaxID=764103 RepID=G7E6S7_MIXOS|nr:uncharacterized protein L969DRAFT_50113 [Mixia osmundae IAM 14324]KEI39080.1 hypothetical protein L969DRAFT_50113 [Mixia osmundae IAM 14324]GAA98537.1 hypothetical protein E5Q_05224 [Mixia osmundae IAM 14324]
MRPSDKSAKLADPIDIDNNPATSLLTSRARKGTFQCVRLTDCDVLCSGIVDNKPFAAQARSLRVTTQVVLEDGELHCEKGVVDAAEAIQCDFDPSLSGPVIPDVEMRGTHRIWHGPNGLKPFDVIGEGAEIISSCCMQCSLQTALIIKPDREQDRA